MDSITEKASGAADYLVPTLTGNTTDRNCVQTLTTPDLNDNHIEW